MQSFITRHDLIERLVKLNSKHKLLIPGEVGVVDWPNLKMGIQRDLDKLRKPAKGFEILAYGSFVIAAIGLVIKLFNPGGLPDLNQGALFIFLTILNMFNAFSLSVRIERLERQLLLIDMLQMIDLAKAK